jgi:autotransporter-associated beta strand protein
MILKSKPIFRIQRGAFPFPAWMISLTLFGFSGAGGVDKYWDATAGEGNGVGGSATWGTTFSTSPTGDATLTTTAAGDRLVFQGTAGVITLAASHPTSGIFESLTFKTSGYVITTGSDTQRSIGGPIYLDPEVTLQINQNSTGSRTIRLNSVSGGEGSILRLNATANNFASRIYLDGAGSTISVPIVFGGSGFGAVVGNGSGVEVAAPITGNGNLMALGATSNNSLLVSGKIDNGSGTVRIALDANATGGGGVVTLSGTGNTWGDTQLDNASNGGLRMGATHALPTGTTVTFQNNAARLDLGGFDTTIGQLSSSAGTAGGTLRNASPQAATLTISGADHSAPAFNGLIEDGPGGGALSLVRAGSGSTTLTGSNTYSGGTTITGGTLVAGSSSALGSGTVSLQGGQLLTSTPNLHAGGLSLSGGILELNGPSAGTLTLAAGKDFTMTGGIWSLQLASATDSIVGSGSGIFSITGGTFDLGGGTIDYSQTYQLISNFSAGSVSGLTFLNYSPSYQPSLSSSGQLSFAEVPEPRGLIVGLLLATGLSARRRPPSSGPPPRPGSAQDSGDAC